MKAMSFVAFLLLSAFISSTSVHAFDPVCNFVDKTPIVKLLQRAPHQPEAVIALDDQINNWSKKKGSCLQLNAEDIPGALLETQDGVSLLARIGYAAYLVDSEAALSKAIPLLQSPDVRIRHNALLFVSSAGSLQSTALMDAVIQALYDSDRDIAALASVRFGWEYSIGLCPCTTETNIKLAEALLNAPHADPHYLMNVLVSQNPTDERILLPMARFISKGFQRQFQSISGIEGIVNYFTRNPKQSPAVLAQIRESVKWVRESGTCNPLEPFPFSYCKSIFRLGKIVGK